MKVQILIQDRRQAEQNEVLGIEASPACEFTDFWFRDEMVESFWIDKKDNEIVFSISGSDYRTPYSEKTFTHFKSII